ncbi:hypothetical protein KKR91_08780 [Arthrobacter jiangjiafuii]|uniref:Uncharacterized protein n=1 Tax=Arthrobacter jiangjiafuii TaxID=2817475 RepID=A0A975QZS0_9MICC|nr:hypothetical protein [Arthrobacter jiangjiafuii]MBP3043094.1 hypothetical protein [Arthrobacter jiangjiafuii]QWC08659.1 hypothetical protein KKR91_08780 [Arthrobacter jiangjiafuii]
MWLAVFAASSAAFTAVVAIRALGGMSGWAYLVVLALVLVLLPLGRTFSQRILLSVVGLAGSAPFMWWVKSDVPYLDRGTVTLGLAVAALVGTLLYTPMRGLSFRRFLPEFRGVDILPLVAAAVSAWVVQSLIFTRTLESTLLILIRSWDYAPHFNMFQMIRNHGAVIAVLPPAADGSQWSAASYPQGYHSLLASLAEIVAGSSSGDTSRELMLFLRLVGVVTVLGTVLVVSAMTSLPVFRRRLLSTLPFMALAATAWTVGPGAIPVSGAFPNFGLAVALCIAVVALVQLRDELHPATASAALILALTAVAHGWILLLVLCAPAGLIYASHLLSLRPEIVWKHALVQMLMITTGIVGILAALWQLRKMSPGEVLTADGGISEADPGVAVLAILANVVVAGVLYARSRRDLSGIRRKTVRSALVLATPMFAAAFLIALAAFQLGTTGEITYYFHKSFLAVELVAIMCTVIGAGSLLIPRKESVGGHRASFVGVSLVASLAATHCFGLPYTSLDQQGIKATAVGSELVLQQRQALSEPTPPLLKKLVAMVDRETEHPFVYVGHDVGFNPQLNAQWSLSLQGAWTEGIQPAISMVKPLYTGPNRVPDAIAPILAELPDVDVMVDPEFVADLQAWRPQYAERIITWAQ